MFFFVAVVVVPEHFGLMAEEKKEGKKEKEKLCSDVTSRLISSDLTVRERAAASAAAASAAASVAAASLSSRQLPRRGPSTVRNVQY